MIEYTNCLISPHAGKITAWNETQTQLIQIHRTVPAQFIEIDLYWEAHKNPTLEDLIQCWKDNQGDQP